MVKDQESAESKIKESNFAKNAFWVAWVPLIGFMFYSAFALLSLYQLGKGCYGFRRLRNGLVVVIFLSVMPIISLIWWAELPNEWYYFFNHLNKHGYYDSYSSGRLDTREYFRFGNSFKTIKNYYYINGIKRYEEIYDQKLISKWTSYYEDGRKQCEGKYKQGKYEGVWAGWYNNGNNRFQIQYLNGEANGAYTFWYENGQIAVQGTYKNGKKDGRWISYNNNGQIVHDIQDYQTFQQADRLFDSKADYNVLIENTDGEYVLIGKTPSVNGKGVLIPKNTHWRIETPPPSNRRLDDVMKDLLTEFVPDVEFSMGTYRYVDKVNIHLMLLQGFPVEKLDLNWLSGIRDDGFSYLRGVPLQIIEMSSLTYITDNAFKHLVGMPVKEITVRKTNYEITEMAVQEVCRLPLVKLSLSDGGFNDEAMLALKETQIKELDLSLMKGLSDAGLRNIKSLQLKSLNLREDAITDAGLAHIKGMPLIQLNLGGTLITDAGLKYLSGMPLKKLDISECSITDSGLQHIKDLPIKELSISDCRITDIGLQHIKDMPIEELDISYCNKTIEELGIKGCITDDGMKYLKHMPLKKLKCCETTDSGVAQLKGMKLEELDLSDCNLITAKGLTYLKGMPLKRLNIKFRVNREIPDKYQRIYDNPFDIKKILDEMEKIAKDAQPTP